MSNGKVIEITEDISALIQKEPIEITEDISTLIKKKDQPTPVGTDVGTSVSETGELEQPEPPKLEGAELGGEAPLSLIEQIKRKNIEEGGIPAIEVPPAEPVKEEEKLKLPGLEPERVGVPDIASFLQKGKEAKQRQVKEFEEQYSTYKDKAKEFYFSHITRAQEQGYESDKEYRQSLKPKQAGQFLDDLRLAELVVLNTKNAEFKAQFGNDLPEFAGRKDEIEQELFKEWRDKIDDLENQLREEDITLEEKATLQEQLNQVRELRNGIFPQKGKVKEVYEKERPAIVKTFKDIGDVLPKGITQAETLEVYYNVLYQAYLDKGKELGLDKSLDIGQAIKQASAAVIPLVDKLLISPEEKEYYALGQKLKALSPLVLLPDIAAQLSAKEETPLEVGGKALVRGLFPTATQFSPTQKEVAENISETFAELDLEVTEPFRKVLEDKSEHSFWQGTFELGGDLLAITPKLAVTGGITGGVMRAIGAEAMATRLASSKRFVDRAAATIIKGTEEEFKFAIAFDEHQIGTGYGFYGGIKGVKAIGDMFKRKYGIIINKYLQNVTGAAIGVTTGMELSHATSAFINTMEKDGDFDDFLKDVGLMDEKGEWTISDKGKKIAQELIATSMLGITNMPTKEKETFRKGLKDLAEEVRELGEEEIAIEIEKRAENLEKEFKANKEIYDQAEKMAAEVKKEAEPKSEPEVTPKEEPKPKEEKEPTPKEEVAPVTELRKFTTTTEERFGEIIKTDETGKVERKDLTKAEFEAEQVKEKEEATKQFDVFAERPEEVKAVVPEKITDTESRTNKLKDAVENFNELSLSKKKANAAIRNKIEIEAKELGFEAKQESLDAPIRILTKEGKPVRRKETFTPTSEVEGFKSLEKRDKKAVADIEKFLEAGEVEPNNLMGMGLGISKKEVKGVISDIREGKNTERAQRVMDILEGYSKEGFVTVSQGSGFQTQYYAIPIKEAFEVIKPTEKQKIDVEKIPDTIEVEFKDALKEFTTEGEINWGALKDRIEVDEGHFTQFPFGYTKEQITNLKTKADAEIEKLRKADKDVEGVGREPKEPSKERKVEPEPERKEVEPTTPEAKVRETIAAIKAGETTPAKSKIGKQMAVIRETDPALVEKLTREYSPVYEEYRKKQKALETEKKKVIAEGKIAEGLEDIAEIIGAKPGIIGNPMDKPKIFSATKKLAEGLFDRGVLEGKDYVRNVEEFMKELHKRVKEFMTFEQLNKFRDKLLKDIELKKGEVLEDQIVEDQFKPIRPPKTQLQKEIEKETGITKDIKWIRSRETTLLKERFRNLARGARIGARATKEELNSAREELKEYLKNKIEIGELGKRDFNSIMTMMKTVNPKNLESALERAEIIISENKKKGLRKGIVKQFKKYKPTIENKILKQKKLSIDQHELLTTSSILYSNNKIGAEKLISKLNKELKKPDISEDRKNTIEAQLKALSFTGNKDMARNEYDALQERIIEEERTPTEREMDEMMYLEMVGSKDLSISELISINNNIKSIIETGKNRMKAKKFYEDNLRDERNRQVLDVLTAKGEKEVLSELEKNKSRGALDNLIWNLTLFRKSQESFTTLMENLSKYDTGKDATPFEGAMHFYSRLLNDATVIRDRNQQNRYEAVGNRATEIYGKNYIKKMKEGDKVEKFEITVFDEVTRSEVKQTVQLSKNEAYPYWQWYQDPLLRSTFEKMGWTDKTIKEIEDFITDKGENTEVLDWAKWELNEFYPEYYPRINAVYRRMFGIDLPQNDVYTPAFRKSRQVKEYDDILDTDQYVSSAINGSLKKRTRNTNELIKVNGHKRLIDHINKMEHFMAHGEALKTIRQTFSQPQVREAINQIHGGLRIIDGFIDDVARGRTDPKHRVQVLDKLRQNFVVAKIGINFPVFLKQLTSFPAYTSGVRIEQIPEFFGHFAEFWTNPVKNSREIWEASPFLQTRYTKAAFEREMVEMSTKVDVKKLQGKSIKDRLLILARLGDAGGIIMGGYPYYRIKLKEGLVKFKGNKAKAKKYAIDKFESLTRLTQQSGELNDLSHIQRWGSFGKVFTMFQNAPMQYLRMEMAAIQNLVTGRGRRIDNLKNVALYHFIMPGLFQFVSSGFRWDDDDMLRSLTLGSLGYAFIVGDLLEATTDAMVKGTSFGYHTIIDQMPNEVIETLEDAKELVEKDEITMQEIFEFSEDIGQTIGDFSGYPVGVVSRSAHGVYDYTTGRTDDERRLLGFSQYALGEYDLSKDAPLVRKHLKGNKDIGTFRKEAKETYGEKYDDNKTRLNKEYRAYKEFGFEDETLNYLFKRGIRNKKKAEYLKELKEEIGVSEFNSLYQRLRTFNVISDDLNFKFTGKKTTKAPSTKITFDKSSTKKITFGEEGEKPITF